MTATLVRDEARKLVDALPDDATWEDLAYRIYVRRKIDAGLKDSREGRTTPHEEVKKMFNVSDA